MLWWIVEPVRLTFYSLILITCVLLLLSPLFGKQRSRVVMWAPILALAVFVPACIQAFKASYPYRFGGLAFPTAQSISNDHVRRWIPDRAVDITCYATEMGHIARFKISQGDLSSWMSKFGDSKAENMSDDAIESSTSESAVIESQIAERDRQWFVDKFGAVHWTMPAGQWVRFASPVAANGAGFEIRYFPSEGTAFTSAGYW